MVWVIVAEFDGEVVGLQGVCDGPFTTRMLRGCSMAVAAALLRRPRLLADRRLWSRLVRRKATVAWAAKFCTEPGVAQMTIGAVSAKTQGHGVLSALIARCEVEGRSRGLRAVRVGLYRRNLACYRVFVKKSGWVEVSALGSDDTTCFVRVFHREVFERFPQLAGAGFANLET
jgi:GNAT superfamily N-acetyltransferase